MLVRLSALLLACWVLSAQDQRVGRGINFYSHEKEAALGAQLAEDTRQRTTSLDSATVHDYVQQLGGQLSAQMPDTGFTCAFTVIADAIGGRIHEPISLPGGYIFVPTSLILEARNEAEFAGMLAHAIAHVAARHGTRQATRGELANQAAIPLIYMGSWNTNGDALIPIGFVNTQRAYELEADRIAVKMMAGAGYDPGALVQYMGRVQSPKTDLQQVRSALPKVEERIANLEREIQALPPRTYSLGEDLQLIKDEVRRLNPPPSPPKPPSLLR